MGLGANVGQLASLGESGIDSRRGSVDYDQGGAVLHGESGDDFPRDRSTPPIPIAGDQDSEVRRRWVVVSLRHGGNLGGGGRLGSVNYSKIGRFPGYQSGGGDRADFDKLRQNGPIFGMKSRTNRDKSGHFFRPGFTVNCLYVDWLRKNDENCLLFRPFSAIGENVIARRPRRWCERRERPLYRRPDPSGPARVIGAGHWREIHHPARRSLSGPSEERKVSGK